MTKTTLQNFQTFYNNCLKRIFNDGLKGSQMKNLVWKRVGQDLESIDIQIGQRFMGTELDTLLRSQHPLLRAKLCTGTHRAKRRVDGQERPGGRT